MHLPPFGKTVPTNAVSSTGSPALEITDKIETSGGGNVYLFWVEVLNSGTGEANNSVIQIEYHDSQSKDYQYLGYALFDKAEFNAHSESQFWLIRSNYNQGFWQTYIMLRDVSDYRTSDFKTYYLAPGDHYLRLTIIADNATSSSKKFKVTVSISNLELPKVEIIPDTAN